MSPKRALLLFAVCSSFLFPDAASVYAQNGEDILLTPDPVTLYLPPDIRIQDAARIDSIVLVAWGSTRSVSAVDFRNVLYVQGIHGGAPVGNPVEIESAEGRPKGYVFVRKNRDRFRVIWNDVRSGAPGLYEREVGPDRLPVGNERLLAKGAVLSIEPFEGGEGLLLLHRAAAPPLLLGGEGELTELADLPDVQTFPWVVSSDSAFGLLQGDSLLLYHSFLDPNPFRRLLLLHEDSALAGSVTLWRNERGEYEVTFVTNGAPSTESPFTATMMLRLVKTTVSSDGSLLEREELDSFFVAAGLMSTLYSFVGVDKVERRRLCNGLYHVRIDCSTREKLPGQPESLSKSTWSYRIEAGGFREIPESELWKGDCSYESAIAVERVNDPQASVVDVRLDAATQVRLVASAALLEERNRHIAPAVTVRDGSLLVTWSEPDRGWPVVLQEWLPDPVEKGRLRSIGIFTAPQESHDASGGYKKYEAEYVPVNEGGYGVLRTQYRSWDSFSRAWVLGWMLTYFFPSRDGWQTMAVDDGAGLEYQGGSFRSFVGLSFDPDRRSGLITSRENSLRLHLLDIDSLGHVIWKGERQTTLNRHISFGNGRFAELSEYGMATIWDRDVAIDTVNFEEWNPDASFARLFAGRTLRHQLRWDKSALQIFLYDADLHLLEQGEIPLADSITGVAVTQSPVDSSIAIITATGRGVYLTALNKGLIPIHGSDGLPLMYRPISSVPSAATAPSACFRNDTLFVVWEDYRNILPDIYGTWLRPVEYVTGVNDKDHGHEIESGFSLVDIFPNPAREQVTVDCRLAKPGRIELLLVDELGRTLWKSPAEYRPAGDFVLDIDCRGYPAGMYRIVGHAGTNHYSESLLILH